VVINADSLQRFLHIRLLRHRQEAVDLRTIYAFPPESGGLA